MMDFEVETCNIIFIKYLNYITGIYWDGLCMHILRKMPTLSQFMFTYWIIPV
jgi:hypothetical protein